MAIVRCYPADAVAHGDQLKQSMDRADDRSGPMATLSKAPAVPAAGWAAPASAYARAVEPDLSVRAKAVPGAAVEDCSVAASAETDIFDHAMGGARPPRPLPPSAFSRLEAARAFAPEDLPEAGSPEAGSAPAAPGAPSFGNATPLRPFVPASVAATFAALAPESAEPVKSPLSVDAAFSEIDAEVSARSVAPVEDEVDGPWALRSGGGAGMFQAIRPIDHVLSFPRARSDPYVLGHLIPDAAARPDFPVHNSA